jgi:hypothetical protein
VPDGDGETGGRAKPQCCSCGRDDVCGNLKWAFGLFGGKPANRLATFFLMKYVKVRWIHSFPDEPIWLFSELDDEQWETRKVEIFADGAKGYASHSETRGSTRLGIVQFPALDDIALDPQFIPEEITGEEFERVWRMRDNPSSNE